MKEFDSQVCLQFSQLATKRKWSISGDISTYKNSNSVWELICHPVKVTLFGEPAQVCSDAARALPFCAAVKRVLIPDTAGSTERDSNDFV